MTKRSPNLGPLEMEALGLLTERSALSVHEVQGELNKNGQDLAYTTVQTVLTRLYDKGLLVREKAGRQYLYSAAKRGRQAGPSLLAKINKALFRSDNLRPIVNLIMESDDLTLEELSQLQELVRERLKAKERSGDD